ncbi:MAG: LysE family transporter [Candidatus Lokiarchaeota archaeon]|nr:LysE family transporter [Candidatus Lokiarchaeota archaeon]
MLRIFLFSFLVALTGALTPGPLLTFTIYKSLKQKKGYLAGVFIILGHATIEFILILVLLAGASLLFQNLLFLTLIGIIGGVFLVIFGILVIRDTTKVDPNLDFNLEDNNLKGYKGNSFIGGIIVSLSNPYWTFWWAVIGLGFLVNFNITFATPIGLLLFFLGHELGDIVWYLPISTFVYFGGKSLNPKIYKYVLLVCAAFMIIFGIYLILNIFISPPQV